MLGDLLYRRVPQVLAGYLGVTWTLFELAQWLTNQYLVSPYLGRALLFGLLLLLPSILLVTYRHGRPGADRWTSLERYGVTANVALAALVLLVAFGDVTLGSMVRTVEAAGPGVEEARTTGSGPSRRVPKKEFRKRVALFYFDAAPDAPADTALRRAAPIALHADLEQDPFVSTFGPTLLTSEVKDHGYESGLDVPLGLMRDAAQQANMAYILTGRVGRSNGDFRLTTRLYETETGDRVAEHRFDGARFFPLVDQATAALKEDLNLPAAHLDAVTDLPVTQVLTASVPAAKHYARGLHADRFVDGSDPRALTHYARATAADSTFAMGHLRTGSLYWRRGREAQARQAFEKAERHSYRLAETFQYALKSGRLFRLENRPEAALQVCERWTSLHPYDLAGWSQKASIYEGLLRYEAAAESYQRVVEIAPETKRAERNVVVNLLRAGELESALQRAQSYAQSYPEDSWGFSLVGVAHWQRGHLDRAREAFRQARSAGSRSATLYLASLHEAQGQFETAHAQIREMAFESDVDWVQRLNAHQKLWHHHWLRGRIGRSRAVLDSLRRIDGPSGGVRADIRRLRHAARTCEYYGADSGVRGASDVVDDALAQARRLRTTLTGGTPGYAVIAEAHLARCLLASGQTDAARRHVARADSIVRRESIPLLRVTVRLDVLRGRLDAADGRLDAAIEHYRRHLDVYAHRREALSAMYPLPRLRLARAYEDAGQWDRADDVYQAALRLRPAHPRLNHRYARLLAAQGRTAAARRHLQRALEGWAPADASFRPKQRAESLLDSLRQRAT